MRLANLFCWAEEYAAQQIATDEVERRRLDAESRAAPIVSSRNRTRPDQGAMDVRAVHQQQVMIVQVSTTSPVARSSQLSHRPAKPMGSPSLRRIR